MQLKLAEAAAKALGAPKQTDAASIGQAAKQWLLSLGQPATRAHAAFAELNAQGPWTFAKLMLISAEFNALVSSVR
jgi:hypothetical protein